LSRLRLKLVSGMVLLVPHDPQISSFSGTWTLVAGKRQMPTLCNLLCQLLESYKIRVLMISQLLFYYLSQCLVTYRQFNGRYQQSYICFFQLFFFLLENYCCLRISWHDTAISIHNKLYIIQIRNLGNVCK
jgi:hypothetical protein